MLPERHHIQQYRLVQTCGFGLNLKNTIMFWFDHGLGLLTDM